MMIRGTVVVDLKPITEMLDRKRVKALKAVSEIAEKNFRRQTSTWVTPHSVTSRMDGQNAMITELISAVPERARVPLAVLLTNTIKKVHGVMSPDFSRKTRPGRLDALPGRGGLLRVSKKRIKGRTIEGRRFAEVNAKDVKRNAANAAANAYAE